MVFVQEDIKLDFSDVLIRPKRSTLTSRKDVQLQRSFTFLHSNRTWTGVPIMSANMDATGTFEIARVLSKHKMLTALHKWYGIDELVEFFKDFNEPDYVAYTLGIRPEDFEKFEQVLSRGLGEKFNFVVLDVPNAYLERFITALQRLRTLVPTHTIIAGNCVTNEMTEEIILRGADIVKVGIGPGSACITRRMAGVGYPQLSAVMECSDAAHGISGKESGCGLIMTDGGMVFPSDVAKAFCAGADFVMSGSLFAGFDQSGGQVITRNGAQYKEYLGSSSAQVMQKYYGKIEDHRASEGRSLHIPLKGDLEAFLQELLGSLRSTATYIGARKLKEFSRRATFIRVNRQLNTSFESFDVTLV